MGFRRNIFTGQLEEFDSEQEKHEFRQEIAEIQAKHNPHPKDSYRNPSVWGRPLRSKAMGVTPAEAAKMNEQARAAGTGAFYDPKTGDCILESRGARNREMMRRGLFDKSGGYGDYTGSSREYMGDNGVMTPSNPYR